MQVPTNWYLSIFSFLRKENVRMEEESETFSMSKSRQSTRGQKIRNKFNKLMKFFLAQGGSCSYDVESESESHVPFRYKHL